MSSHRLSLCLSLVRTNLKANVQSTTRVAAKKRPSLLAGAHEGYCYWSVHRHLMGGDLAPARGATTFLSHATYHLSMVSVLVVCPSSFDGWRPGTRKGCHYISFTCYLSFEHGQRTSRLRLK